MKTPHQIQVMIDETIESITELKKEEKKNKSKIKRQLNTLSYLKEMKMYLETDPEATSIKRDYEKISNIIESKYSNYDYWFKRIAPFGITKKEAELLFKKENNIDKLKSQLKTLKFILE